MKLHIKSPGDRPGVYRVATRGRELKYLSFTIVRLGPALMEHQFESSDEELSLDSYGGPVRVQVDGWSADIPARSSIAEAGSMVYIPSGAQVRLTALNGQAHLAIGGAEGKKGGEPRLISSPHLRNTVGKENWTRTVFTHIADNVQAAHLIAGETVNQPGGWSSCPPHKHDRFAPPSEVPMEEVYYFQIEPRQGFGFMRVYTDSADPEPFDHAYPVEHGDTVLIPRGYHPVAACPGYTLNYTWILAGEGRTYGAWSDDPRHSWIKKS